MPELPEVETTLRGVRPYLEGRRIERLAVRDARLRYPVPADLGAALAGQRIHGLRRRGKYLLLDLDRGNLLIHLGMSGSLARFLGGAGLVISTVLGYPFIQARIAEWQKRRKGNGPRTGRHSPPTKSVTEEVRAPEEK